MLKSVMEGGGDGSVAYKTEQRLQKMCKGANYTHQAMHARFIPLDKAMMILNCPASAHLFCPEDVGAGG